MAVILSGLVLLGVQPGPGMAGRDLDLTYTVIWSLALANVLGTAICIVIAPAVSRLTTIRYALIAPFMVMVNAFASFRATRSVYDLVTLLAAGTVGVMLRRFGWPRPAFLIGFVLAGQSESYLYQAVQFSGWGFIGRSIVLVIIAITVLSIWMGARSRSTLTLSDRQSHLGLSVSEQRLVYWLPGSCQLPLRMLKRGLPKPQFAGLPNPLLPDVI